MVAPIKTDRDDFVATLSVIFAGIFVVVVVGFLVVVVSSRMGKNNGMTKVLGFSVVEGSFQS